MNVLSVCSGIGAEMVAWRGLGWRTIAFAEVASFPCAVLTHHYPSIQNLGDLNDYKTWTVEPDLIVGGTPCQSFSIAGGRQGLGDERGALTLRFCELVERCRPKWFVWENVPNVVAGKNKADFASIIKRITERGYGLAWRVLDARDFRLAATTPTPIPCRPSWKLATTCGKYCLSAKFARAILRADEKATRKMPARLKVALTRIASTDTASDSDCAENYTAAMTKNMGTGGNSLPFIYTHQYGHERRKNFARDTE